MIANCWFVNDMVHVMCPVCNKVAPINRMVACSKLLMFAKAQAQTTLPPDNCQSCQPCKDKEKSP